MIKMANFTGILTWLCNAGHYLPYHVKYQYLRYVVIHKFDVILLSPGVFTLFLFHVLLDLLWGIPLIAMVGMDRYFSNSMCLAVI